MPTPSLNISKSNPGQRAVQTERDAIGNIVITGDGNVIAPEVLKHLLGDRFSEAEDSEHAKEDEGGGRDPWIVKTLDHLKQVNPLRDRFQVLNSPAIAVVEGCGDDLPHYLADDVFLDPWPALDDIPQEATNLPLGHKKDESAFWKAIHEYIPELYQGNEPESQRVAVRNWLSNRDRHLFRVSISIKHEGRKLPNLIRAAQAFLAELSRCEPGKHLLMLI